VQYDIIITDFNWGGGGVNEVSFFHNIETIYGTLLRLRETENAHTLIVHIIRYLLNQNFPSIVDRKWGGGPVNSPTQSLDLNCKEWAVGHLKTLTNLGPSVT